MKLYHYAAMVVLCYGLAACQTLGIQGPQSPEEKLAAGYAIAEGVNRAATQLLREKKISSADAQHVLSSTQSARQGLDIARPLLKIDPKSATAKIEAQRAILTALQKYLNEKGAK